MRLPRMVLLAAIAVCFSGEIVAQPRGRWRKSRKVLTEEQQRRIEQLESLGYLAGSVDAPALEGVTIFDKDRAYQGLNFYTSGHAAEAVLLDMEGHILHKWERAVNTVWSEVSPGGLRSPVSYWRKAHLLENGDVLLIFDGRGIVKIDKDSNLIWASYCRAHHDLDIAPNGDIYILTREANVIPRIHEKDAVLEDFISILDSSGTEKGRVSLVECFDNSEQYWDIWWNRKKCAGDILHTNTVEVLEGGRVLFSLRNMDLIGIADLERRQIVWAYQGDFRGQHDPTVLSNGNLLLFNNNWAEGKNLPAESSILEYAFSTMDLEWEYRGTPEQPFYTAGCGTVQRLPNGNTLMTESDAGRAFEVTSGGEIVWEFYSPHRAGENGEFIATLFEMQRLDADFPLDWIQD